MYVIIADMYAATQKKRAQHSSQGSASSDDWLKHELLSLLEDASQLRRPSFQDVMLQLRATAANAEVFMRQNLVVVISLVWSRRPFAKQHCWSKTILEPNLLAAACSYLFKLLNQRTQRTFHLDLARAGARIHPGMWQWHPVLAPKAF